jgi:hypothetical protein
VTSIVDASPTIHFPATEKLKRSTFSNIVTVAFILLDMLTVYGVFAFKGIISGAMTWIITWRFFLSYSRYSKKGY